MLPWFPLAARPVGDPSTSCPRPRPPSPLSSTAELLDMNEHQARPPSSHPAMVTDGLGAHGPRGWTPELPASACRASDAAPNTSERVTSPSCRPQRSPSGAGPGRPVWVRGPSARFATRPLHFPPAGHRGPSPTSPPPHSWSSGVSMAAVLMAAVSRWGSTRISCGRGG